MYIIKYFFSWIFSLWNYDFKVYGLTISFFKIFVFAVLFSGFLGLLNYLFKGK